LKDACAVRPHVSDSTIVTHRRRLDRKLDRILNLKPTDVEGSHLRTGSDCQWKIPPRRRAAWAKVYSELCSVVATGRLAGCTALAVIRDTLAASAPKRTADPSSGSG
jgi:hypothetical protein